MRVLFLNNYSIDGVYRRATTGIDHLAHTWGYDYFLARSESSVAGFSLPLFSMQMKLRTYLVLGDLAQQFEAFRKKDSIDAIVAGNLSVIGALSYLKRFIPLPRLVGILHSVRHYKSRLGRILLRQRLAPVDRIVCLARKDFAYLRSALELHPKQVTYVPWSANLADYDRASGCAGEDPAPYVMCMGLTDRDYRTLIEAFRLANTGDCELRIYTGPAYTGPVPVDPHVHLITDWVSFRDSVPLYRGARFVVVPLLETKRTLGLTSLLDAMAVGRAVIMTRNPGIDIDIEAERIGFWVAPGDAAGLANKLSYLQTHPEVAAEMGANGRRFLEERWNYTHFCQCLFAEVRNVCGTPAERASASSAA